MHKRYLGRAVLLLFALLMVVVVTPMTNQEEKRVFEDARFPNQFFFGTASSDFQTTGGDGNTDWNLYVSECLESGKCKDDFLNKDQDIKYVGPGNGTDFFNRYKEDFDLASGKTQVHRISLEWSRIEPKENEWNEEALERYRTIFKYMKSKGIEPMICLNHFALPMWFVEKGGWESLQFPYYYSRYAEKLAQEIGVPLKIKWWLTFNEPQVILAQSYIKGSWPPFKSVESLQDMKGTHRLVLVLNNVMEAHRQSYRSIHKVMDARFKPMVSFASAPGAFYPNDPDSKLDQLAVNTVNFMSSLLFDFTIGTSDRDFIGLNYYGRTLLKFHISLPAQMLSWLTDTKPFAIEWMPLMQNMLNNRPTEFYSKGLYDLIMQFSSLGLPIVITENGMHDPTDKFREEFLVLHLKAVHDAIRDGANVIGYQYWALTDTWEWSGTFSEMGFIGIDRKDNLRRFLRPSALSYEEIIKTGIIKKELLEKYQELMPDIPPREHVALKYDSSVEENLCPSVGDKFNKGVVSLTFDDGWKEIYENGLPILNEAGIKSTHYPNIHFEDWAPSKYITNDAIPRLEKSGHEVGSHGVNHDRFTELTDVQIRESLINSRQELQKMGIKSVETFAYPYGDYNDAIIQLIRDSGYTAARTVIPGMNDRSTDRFLLYSYPVDNTMLFEPYLRRIIDRARTEKKWLILTYHQIAKPDYQFFSSPEDLRLLVNYLIKNEVPVMTVKDVIGQCYLQK